MKATAEVLTPDGVRLRADRSGAGDTVVVLSHGAGQAVGLVSPGQRII